MITVPEATKEIVERSRYLTEAMSKNLINLSSLARYIKPEIEHMLVKEVSTSSLLMALKRIQTELKPKYVKNTIFPHTPELTIQNSVSLISGPQTAIKDISADGIIASTVSDSTCTLLISRESAIWKMMQSNPQITLYDDLSVITIRMPDKALHTAGIYYFFLKSIAWEGINIHQMFSTPDYIKLVVADQDIERVFAIIKTLFTS